jgi:acetolactate synthase regulatory subunit
MLSNKATAYTILLVKNSRSTKLGINTISKLIDVAYEDQVKGEAYRSKIIQLSIAIPGY